MATQLDIMNRVLRRLREDTVPGSTANPYAALISEFVMDAVQSVSEASEWQSNIHTVMFDSVVDQREYKLSKYTTTGGATDVVTPKLPNYRSRVMMSPVNFLPLAFNYDDDQDDTGHQMMLLSEAERINMKSWDRNQRYEYPHWFSLDIDSTQELIFKFAYKPQTVRKHEITFYTEIDMLSSDGSTDNVEVYLPTEPIFWHAYMFALNERGEEYGEPAQMAMIRYNETLAAAINADKKHNEYANQYDWYRG